MTKPRALAIPVLLMTITTLEQEPTIRVEPPQLQGSRFLEKQTESSVIRDYLQSWNSLEQALDRNEAPNLDPDFIGVARDKLAETIDAQRHIGIHTRYQDRSHDIQIVFYSPEGLSIEMTDDVEYQQLILEKDKVLATQTVHRRYVVVLTPSEVRWQVRVLQSKSD